MCVSAKQRIHASTESARRQNRPGVGQASFTSANSRRLRQPARAVAPGDGSRVSLPYQIPLSASHYLIMTIERPEVVGGNAEGEGHSRT